MEILIKGENLQEILEAKNSLEYGGYKGNIKVLLTKELEKDIMEKIGPVTASIQEGRVNQVFGIDIIYDFNNICLTTNL